MTCFRALQQKHEADFRTRMWKLAVLKAELKIYYAELNELREALMRLGERKDVVKLFDEQMGKTWDVTDRYKKLLKETKQKYPEAFK